MSDAQSIATDDAGAVRRRDERRVIVQISDVHVVTEGLLHGLVDPLDNLRQILDAVARGPVPDLLLFTGDLADKGEPVAYERFRATVEPAASRIGVPVLYMPGNHDQRAPFRQHLLDGDATDEVIDQVRCIGDLRIVTLDSTVPDEAHGELEASQLEWLAAQLETRAPLGTIVALHHPPIPGPVEFLDRIMLRNARDLGAVITGTDVVMVLAGHTHHASAGVLAGVPVWVATATAYQMDVLSSNRAMRGLPGLGFSRIDVTPSGAIATYLPVLATDRPVYEVDFATLQRFLDHEAPLEEVEAAFGVPTGRG
jgi:Icc protein